MEEKIAQRRARQMEDLQQKQNMEIVVSEDGRQDSLMEIYIHNYIFF